MNEYFLIVLVKAPGFHGKLPFVYNATYINPKKAEQVKQVFEEQNPTFEYKIVKISMSYER